jgi:hypothetical protein
VTQRLDIEDLLRYEANEDGTSINLVVVSGAAPVALTFTVTCLSRLLLTLPRMINKVVQKRGNNPDLRVVYPLEALRVERVPDHRTRILTLKTPDGFDISFTADPDKFREIYEIVGESAGEYN